uniref:Putative ovule protein n=1 Tax=Solanum chacoense TaxID=4108 RepID=A0A0V0I7E6_SOLCH
MTGKLLPEERKIVQWHTRHMIRWDYDFFLVQWHTRHIIQALQLHHYFRLNKTRIPAKICC